jgi:PAS domain S-box-containing protein
MLSFFSQNCDYAVFTGVTLGIFLVMAWILARTRKGARLPGYIWLLAGLVLIGGWWRVQDAGEAESQRLARLVSAMTPTYARELARMGHAQLTLETKAEDPLYQRLLQAQREWMQDNPNAHDIYTMRLLPDGRKVFMVDADTDYDHDGKISENEKGADLGEAYEVPDEGLEKAFRGQANFDFEPITDQWGTWVGAWAPIYNEAGKVEAVLGVDYDAAEWFAAVAAVRRERILQLGFFLATIGAAGWAIGALRTDLARRRRVEEGLRQAQERWKLTVEQMPLAFIEWNAQAEIIAWNPEAERIFGYRAAEVVGKEGVVRLVTETVRPHVDGIWRDLLAQTGGRRSVNENVTRDGRTITCEWFNTPVVDRGGRVVNVLSLVQDITQRLSLEQQMLQSQKMQAVGLLAAGIAHDFNNLLTIIQGHTELLLAQDDLPTLGREDAERIALAAERAANLTRQLLTFSRRQAMFARPMQLNDSLTASAEMLERVLGADIVLRTEFAPDLPAVEADPSMLDQVITNLAVNSRDAMPRGGVLTLATSLVEIPVDALSQHPDARAGAAICLCVSDTGCGIPAEKLPHIFEPFFTTKEVGKGTGLGLSAVHGIVKQHHGWIEVGSELGRGTTVKIFLPPCALPVAEVATPIPLVAPGPDLGRLGILVVEDEHSVRALARKTLEQAGYRVFVAADGPSAQAVWIKEKHQIDVLFTDMVMPNGLSGRDIAEQFLSERPDLRVIYASGYSIEVAAPGFLESETQTFMPKPYLPTELVTAVRRCLGVTSALHAA